MTKPRLEGGSSQPFDFADGSQGMFLLFLLKVFSFLKVGIDELNDGNYYKDTNHGTVSSVASNHPCAGRCTFSEFKDSQHQ